MSHKLIVVAIYGLSYLLDSPFDPLMPILLLFQIIDAIQ